MGSTPRAEYRGALYHVFARGVRRERIFCDVEDYLAYVADLRHLADDLGVKVLAYCLMPNHPHLCLKTDDAPLSELMQRLNTRHALRFNRKYKVTGHLHEGRYRALLIDSERYLLRLVRYIHQNPVRAGLVPAVDDWPFSSHRDYCAPATWVHRDEALSRFVSHADYQVFVSQSANLEDSEIFSSVGRGFRFAGSLESVSDVRSAVARDSTKHAAMWIPLGNTRPPPTEDISAQAEQWLRERAESISLHELQGLDQHDPIRRVRRELAAFLRAENHSLRAIGLLLHRKVAAVSRLVGRHEQQPSAETH
jgi:REP element-mobilizing transposase RayT